MFAPKSFKIGALLKFGPNFSFSKIGDLDKAFFKNEEFQVKMGLEIGS